MPASDRSAQLHHDSGFEQRQVLDFVDDDAVEVVEAFREVVVTQLVDGTGRGDELGKKPPARRPPAGSGRP